MLPECTLFSNSQPDVFEDFLFDLQTEFPDIVEDRDVFMQKIENAYDRFVLLQKPTTGGLKPSIQKEKNNNHEEGVGLRCKRSEA